MPKISVIIPVYNTEKQLKRCLDSVLNQTLSDIEVLCVNDGSTDNSLQILQAYALQSKGVLKVINLAKNSGACAARNLGLQAAQGEYIGFIDSDDYVDLNFYEALYQKAITENADIAKALLKEIKTDGTEEVCDLNAAIEQENDKFLFSYQWTTAIYRRDLLTKHHISLPADLTIAEDDVFLFHCVLHANKVATLRHVFYYYMRRLNSLHENKISLEKMQSACSAVRYMLSLLNQSNMYVQNPQQYVKIFRKRYEEALWHIYRSCGYEAKYEGAKLLTDIYHMCRAKEAFEPYFMPILKQAVLRADTAGLADILNACDSAEELGKENVLWQLRSRAKKDFSHA